MKKISTFSAAAALAAVLALGACSSTSTPSRTTAANEPEPTILLIPVQINDPALKTGCWAQFYSDRNFKGDLVTLVGPAELATLDKGTARQLKRDLDSLTVGPRATLKVFEHAMFKDREVTFPPNSREGGLVTKLGFGGRIEGLQLSCS